MRRLPAGWLPMPPGYSMYASSLLGRGLRIDRLGSEFSLRHSNSGECWPEQDGRFAHVLLRVLLRMSAIPGEVWRVLGKETGSDSTDYCGRWAQDPSEPSSKV